MSKDKLQTAYDTFEKRIGRMLVRKGAERRDITYRLPTPGGVLVVKPWRNWLFCRFENPLGGFIVSHGLSHPDSGVWNTNYSRDADLLVADSTFNQVECEIDSFLTRTLGPYELAIIEAVDIHGLPLRDKFLATFYRLQSVNMAAREVVESVTPSWENFDAAYRGKFLPNKTINGSSSR